MAEVTIAEERYARMIAYYHVAKIVYCKPSEGSVTVAAMRGYDSGWAYETDRYVDHHWEEYLLAARAVLEFR